MVEWDKAAHQVTAHRSSFGKLVIAPVSYVSFYPFKLYCVFVCKFGECFMAVSDGCVFYWREPVVQIGCRSKRLFVGC